MKSVSENVKELKQKISGYILKNSKGEYIEIDDEDAEVMLKNKDNV